jgi:hypothetical protein
MNKFTLIIHNKGWTVKEACQHWGIRYETYNRHCNSDKFANRLESMCNGLFNRDSDTVLTIEECKELVNKEIPIDCWKIKESRL